MLIYTYLELYYIYVLYDIIYLLQSVPSSGSVFFLNKRIEYQKTVVRLAYIDGFVFSLWTINEACSVYYTWLIISRVLCIYTLVFHRVLTLAYVLDKFFYLKRLKWNLSLVDLELPTPKHCIM